MREPMPSLYPKVAVSVAAYASGPWPAGVFARRLIYLVPEALHCRLETEPEARHAVGIRD